MKLNFNIFASKFARRIFLVFFLGALIPVCGLAAITYQQVNQQFGAQFRTRLQQSLKTYSLFFYERILNLETELNYAAIELNKRTGNFSKSMDNNYLKRLQKRFAAVNLVDTTGNSPVLFGHVAKLEFNEKEIHHLTIGKTLVKLLNNSTGEPEVLMITLLDSRKPASGYLAAKINPDYLLALKGYFHLPPDTDLIVQDESQKIFYSSLPKGIAFPDNFSPKIAGRSLGTFKFGWKNEDYLACFRWVFTQPNFLFPGFNITFIQSKTNTFLQLVEFKKIYPQVILLSLLVIIILSIYFIRKSLEPLKLLKEGTRQIAENNFTHRVEIYSRDEFAELAEAFNQMAIKLSNQIKILETSAQITHAVLSSLDTHKIFDTVISRMTDCFACEAINIGLVCSEQPYNIQCHLAARQPENRIRKVDCKLLPYDLIKLHNNQQFMLIDKNQELPDYLSLLDGDGIGAFLVLPIFLDAHLTAIISLAYRDAVALNDDRFRGRQMADQVAVALSNSRLVEQLNRLNWGTLRALARAVDAKSPWTAGHSERVTALALKLADILIVDPRERENLHRAALLHDIGKLGVPVVILDKPGKLTVQEYETIKAHPQIGARILEPIEEYAPIIPMVLQHHECFDGKGYPAGLSGNSIHFGARILAVADAFDAMNSKRPYRDGMPLERVMQIVQRESSRQFDPEVVQALIALIYHEATKAA